MPVEDPEAQTPRDAGGRRPPLPLPPRAPLLAPTAVDAALRRLEAFLALLGFHHHSCSVRLLSCSAFLLLGVAAPSVSIYLARCPDGKAGASCEGYQVERFEICVLVFEALIAAASLACVSRNLFKYGIRRFLFVDQQHGQAERFQKEYVSKIQDFFCLLLWWILPCFIVKAAREIIRFAYIYHDSVWKSIIVLLGSIVSWAYLTTIFLSACTLFSLVCNLQVVHFEDYCKLLERDTDILLFLEEHKRLRYYLSKISHRFRVLLVLLFLLVTASQVVTLFLTTGYRDAVSFTTAGDLAVSSVVQVVGAVLCLHAAAKISHRAQGIASVACRWHAFITCGSADTSHLRSTNSFSTLEAFQTSPLIMDYSESDLESLDVPVQTNTQFATSMSSYHKRQALVTYLQSNPGGITIFGWTVDRGLINTLFFIEMSLVTFVLGKTIVFSAQ